MESKLDLCFSRCTKHQRTGVRKPGARSTADRLGLIAALVMQFSSTQDFREKDRSNEE
jgi:hypothetical protein